MVYILDITFYTLTYTYVISVPTSHNIYVYYIIYAFNKPLLFPSGQTMTNHPDLLDMCLFSFVDTTIFL